MADNATVPYGGVRGVVNCTVLPAELQRDLAKQKEDFAKSQREHQEHRRVKKGSRKLSHKLPPQEEYTGDGEAVIVKETTTTKRTNN